MARNVLTYNLSEPNPGSAEAKIDINTVDGNLQIDAASGGSLLASGTLQYLENQEPPTQSIQMEGRQALLMVKSGRKGQSWLRLPWAACNGATEWQIHLNPNITLDIKAHSGGGNVLLDLSGLMVNNLTADTGGGNLEVSLPDRATRLTVAIKSGAGNVTIRLPSRVAARVHATTGLGKVILEGTFVQMDKYTYQSPGFENSVDQVEITASSGAGNVIIKERISAAIHT